MLGFEMLSTTESYVSFGLPEFLSGRTFIVRFPRV